MITAKDIQEKTFQRAGRGYNMGEVDAFLDEIVADINAMQKENASLKSKMRVLVEKVEEYRQTEDSMRLALMSAQKMGAQIESEAQQKADALMAQAKDSADRMTRRATDGVANEEAKLAEAKKATDKFFEHMKTVCEKQIEFYDKLSRMQLVGGDSPAPAARPAESEVDRTVRSIESSAVKAALEPEERMEVDTDLPEEEDEPTRRYGDAQPKKKRDFDDFKFDEDI